MKAPAKRPAFLLFFPLAALLAALTVPLSVWAVLSGSGWPPGLLGSGHGHEMVFGFALALIAGYTLGNQPQSVLYPLVGLWLAARLAWMLIPDSWLALLLSPAFALLLAWHVVPRFNAAKKWRNRITGPLILTVCLLPLAWLGLLAAWRYWPDLARGLEFSAGRLLHAGVLCLLLLMMFMGGRIIAPAATVTLERKGIEPRARLQPHMESALIILLGLAILPLLLPGVDSSLAYRWSGLCLLAAAGVLAVRCWRWELWRCIERPDLLAFGIGYAWLAVGSLLCGVAFLGQHAAAPALHLITIGGLGTLSTGVMLRLYFQRASKTPPGTGWVCCITTLVAIAALSRFASGPAAFGQPILLWISAASWALAYIALLAKMLELNHRLR
ncbi:NnrS family protein [Pseudomonas saudimassiliensis]|uniref:NnrS family protein n=1 Tax=Pseudomonas saudimassiliensis TaxID=1461581 RepID=A0A078M4L7_9PSED|nr:NnrS family protein [Pseudomonas saudimassiliensis]CEA01245.1 NnrS family protein [Pseudomonas saudimassiliensis]CEF25449.1 NnrS family protein [Pseudomonas saudimassiliensis]